MAIGKMFTATEILGIESDEIEVEVEIKSKGITSKVALQAPSKSEFDQLRQRFFKITKANKGKKSDPMDQSLDVAHMCLHASLVNKMEESESWKLLLLAGAEFSELGITAIEVCGLGQFFDLRGVRDARDRVLDSAVEEEKGKEKQGKTKKSDLPTL